MKLVFVSNYLTHHQLPLCRAFYQLLGKDSFCFISTVPMEMERVQMGWVLGEISDFEIKAYVSQPESDRALQAIEQADVIITGAASPDWQKICLRQDAVCFVYSERLFKKGYINALRPGYIRHALNHRRLISHKRIYALCASAYLPGDYKLLLEYPNRCFRWGYFPEVNSDQKIDAILQQKDPWQIVWVGRLINCKHPELALAAFERLVLEGYPVYLRFVGDGAMAAELKEKAARMGLAERITFVGNIPHQQVCAEMERAAILLATSDFNEGWGAIINEGMHAGCAVVASHAMGSVPYLIEDGKNGLIYPNGSAEKIYEALKKLLDNPAYTRTVGENAHNTTQSLWSAEVAAQRLLALTEDLRLGGKGDLFPSGPCSKAPVLWNHWMK